MANDDNFWLRFAVRSAELRDLPTENTRLLEDASVGRCSWFDGDRRTSVLELKAQAWTHVVM